MERPRSVVGRYTLYDKIAAGGMATVHLGRLRGPVGFARTVAIKRLRSHFAEEPEFVAMFVDEARLAARIRHPNVVSTFDVAAVDGELLLVMDYVQGESLAHLVSLAREKGPPPRPEMIATIMAGVLHGLHAAHEAKDERGEPLQIVHRDVSPQNILVGVDGVARVLDFGVAKAVGRLHTTRDGQIKGKLAYMAPEQILAQPVDRRTDVYGAAAVLWESLTGERLFVGANDGATVHNVLEGTVSPPSARASGISPALDALTLRGLSRDPKDRFPTARDMARALEEAVPPVVASLVGEWVEATARDGLAERARLVASMESDRDTPAPRPVAADISPAGDQTRPLTGASEVEATVRTETSVVTKSGPKSAPARARSRIVTGIAAAAGAAVLVLVGIVGVGRDARTESTTPASPASSPLPPSGLAAAGPAPLAAPAAFPSDSSTASVPPAASTVSAASSAIASPTRPRPTNARPAAPAKAAAKKYVFDHL